MSKVDKKEKLSLALKKNLKKRKLFQKNKSGETVFPMGCRPSGTMQEYLMSLKYLQM